MWNRMWAALLGAASMGVAMAQAQVSDLVRTGNAETRLAAEHMSAAPGEKITVALMQTLKEGWHVYWQNPGDSGLPLRLDWDMPNGFQAGPIAYPLPERLAFGELVTFGHEGAPAFLADLTVPADARPGTTAKLAVDANWLICADICVPEKAELTLTLPITEEKGAPNGAYAMDIGRAKRNQPRQPAFDAVYYHSDRGPVLHLSDAPEGELEFFPYSPALIEPSGMALHAQDADAHYISMASAFGYETTQPVELAGVLVVDNGRGRRGFEIFASRKRTPESLPRFEKTSE